MTEDLTAFRARIDAIDDELLALFERRSNVVAEVGAYKREQSPRGLFLRPGREASMVRRIAAQAKGPVDPIVYATMWRTLIAGSTRIEQDFRLAAYAPGENRDMFWLGREYFGPFTPITLHPNAKRVLGEMLENERAIGLLPFYGQQLEKPWWLDVIDDGPARPKIFARIPFVARESSPTPEALAIGFVAPEPTGDDRTPVAIETQGDTSRSRLANMWEKSGVPCTWIASSPGRGGRVFQLFELHGFITPESDAYQAFMQEAGENGIVPHILGAYATPMKA